MCTRIGGDSRKDGKGKLIRDGNRLRSLQGEVGDGKAIRAIAACGFVLFYGIKYARGLRVEARVEEEGLDIYEHGKG